MSNKPMRHKKNILLEILEYKKNELKDLKKHKLNLNTGLRNKEPLDFKKALTKDKMSIIAEVKKASPSQGVIRPHFDHKKIALDLYQAGANAFSVLTDSKFFGGCNEYLNDIHQMFSIPTLRKDFIIDPWQIEESYSIGADAILLIVKALTSKELFKFQKLAKQLKLSSLVEVHDFDDLKMALDCGSEIIGINNRNLENFEIDLEISLNLAKYLPEGVVKISESGISSSLEVKRLWQAGFNSILVGTHIMRSNNLTDALNDLTNF